MNYFFIECVVFVEDSDSYGVIIVVLVLVYEEVNVCEIFYFGLWCGDVCNYDFYIFCILSGLFRVFCCCLEDFCRGSDVS